MCFGAVIVAAVSLTTVAGAADILAAEYDGRPLEAITAEDLVGLRDIVSSSVSPDGAWVAYQLRQANLETNSYWITWHVAATTASGNPVRVGDGGEPIFNKGPFGYFLGTFDAGPAQWSPDGQWIVYRRKTDGEIQLWRSRVDGSDQEQLTRAAADVLRFRWNSEGSKIFFETEPPRSATDGAGNDQAGRGYLFDARFSPFYSTKPQRLQCSFYDRDWLDRPGMPLCTPTLWAVDFETGHQRLATPEELADYKLPPPPGPRPDVAPERVIRVTASMDDGRQIAWLENEDPAHAGHLPPLTVFSSRSPETACPAVECRGRLISDLRWSGDGKELYFLRREGVAYSVRAYYAWAPETGDVRTILRTDDRLSSCQHAQDRMICLHDGPTVPKRIVSVDLKDGGIEVIVDPNSQFRGFRFGEVEKLAWKDGFGNDTFGHLVYPLDYVAGQRYPLVVVQYQSDGFLRGGTGDEYPIHVLASNGFAVLSFDRPADWIGSTRPRDVREHEQSEWKDLYEKRRALTALETVIERLDDRGLIDVDRIGITGLSDGAETLYFSLIHSNRFAAASASGGSYSTILYYLMPEGLRDYFNQNGLGRLGGPNDVHWADIDVSLNDHKIRAPLLVQVADHELLMAVQGYVALKEAGKPIEMYVFPDEYHVKWQPKHRHNIYRRNVQWFNFWLRGVEDPDPVDPEQYARWRKLREQHQASQRAPGQARRAPAALQPPTTTTAGLDGE